MNLISILKISYNFLADYLGPVLDEASPVGMVVLFQEMGIREEIEKAFPFSEDVCESALCGEKTWQS